MRLPSEDYVVDVESGTVIALKDGEVVAVDEMVEKVMESLRTPLQDFQAMGREIDDQTAKELLVNGFLDMRWTSWLLGEVMADAEVFDD